MEDYPFKTYKGFLKAWSTVYTTEFYMEEYPKLEEFLNDLNSIKDSYMSLPDKEKNSLNLTNFISMLVWNGDRYACELIEEIFNFIDYLLLQENIFPGKLFFEQRENYRKSNKNYFEDEVGHYNRIMGPILKKYFHLISKEDLPEGWNELIPVNDWETFTEDEIEKNFDKCRLRYIKHFTV